MQLLRIVFEFVQHEPGVAFRITFLEQKFSSIVDLQLPGVYNNMIKNKSTRIKTLYHCNKFHLLRSLLFSPRFYTALLFPFFTRWLQFSQSQTLTFVIEYHAIFLFLAHQSNCNLFLLLHKLQITMKFNQNRLGRDESGPSN